MSAPTITDSGATIRDCGRYRYDLWRLWDSNLRICSFICLNPSTADATKDDPTVRRCIGFAHAWGYGRFVMLNAYAYRATDPREMKRAEDPIGPDNLQYIEWWAKRSHIVVAAWGTHCNPIHAKTLRCMVPNLCYLRLTKAGAPGHPLYLPKSLTPTPWAQNATPNTDKEMT